MKINILLITLLIVCLDSCRTAKYEILREKSIYPICYDQKWGYVDGAGEIVIDTMYTKTYLPTFGIGLVQEGDKYGYIRSDGSWLIKPVFDKAYPFALSYVHSKDHSVSTKTPIGLIEDAGKFKYIKTDGDSVPMGHVFVGESSSCEPFRNYVEDISIKNTFGQYELIHNYIQSDSNNRLIKVRDTTKHLALDTIIKYSDHTYLVQSKGKYGVIFKESLSGYDVSSMPMERIITEDPNYSLKVNFKYDSIKFYNSKFYGHLMPTGIAKIGEYWGHIDAYGTEMIPFIYYDINENERDNLRLVEFEPGNFGYIDLTLIKSEASSIRYEVKEYFKRSGGTESNRR